MARSVVFDGNAWDDYVYWQRQDSKTLDRINQLIRACQRDPFQGIGKPEPLRGKLAGFWSRRIDDSNRLVYRISNGSLEVVACRYHYGDR